jgi:hypothetical protein
MRLAGNTVQVLVQSIRRGLECLGKTWLLRRGFSKIGKEQKCKRAELPERGLVFRITERGLKC